MSEKLTERHCLLCEDDDEPQIGGVYMVVCKRQTCGSILADETEANPYVASLEEEIERLRRLLDIARNSDD